MLLKFKKDKKDCPLYWGKVNTSSTADEGSEAGGRNPKLNDRSEESYPHARAGAGSQNKGRINDHEVVRNLLPFGHSSAKAKKFRISLVNGIVKK